jgi:hypothetical protein
MTWVKIDDSFPNHPKIVGLTDKAFRIHISGLCYCGTYLTDGFIPMTIAAQLCNNDFKHIAELCEAGLWKEAMTENGFRIHDYLAHQTSKTQVEEKRQTVRERQKRYRERHKTTEAEPAQSEGGDDGWSNALVTPSEYRIQNTDNRIQSTEYINTEEEEMQNLPAPRNKSAKLAVEIIGNKLALARADGINAWNLSKLVEEEWDKLHAADDIGGCIALTAWYVSELQTRQLSSAEIGRIGQMTKRFGRIALLAIDEAASKDLTDLVSYAFRVAQNMYASKAAAQ